MRPSPPTGRKPGRGHTVPGPSIASPGTPEHVAAVIDGPEGIAAGPLPWTETRRSVEEGHALVPLQRSATTRRQPSTMTMTSDKKLSAPGPPAKDITSDSMVEGHNTRRTLRLRNPWACSLYTLVAALLGFAALFLMMQSFTTRQLDTKGCEMSYMRPIFHRFHDFDTEHTRFASKYSLYLYREGGIDEDSKVGCRIRYHNGVLG